MAAMCRSAGPQPFLSLSTGERKRRWAGGPSDLSSWLSKQQQEHELHKDGDHTCGILSMASQALCREPPRAPLVASPTAPLHHGLGRSTASFPAQVLKLGQGWWSSKAMAVPLLLPLSQMLVTRPPERVMQQANGANLP